uniref:RRM domain-containing protein n=1 Tax=Alexandrium monilatum TaxID=311494 RepID=A0A7S4RFY8_9DINO|mmetsp:Transcript_1016/g.3440  ORF Transcript_1016/g.3440 Transcript_1016/m.3440 type:complete len:557 (+) Transcript_1016:91-1761(+)
MHISSVPRTNLSCGASAGEFLSFDIGEGCACVALLGATPKSAVQEFVALSKCLQHLTSRADIRFIFLRFAPTPSLRTDESELSISHTGTIVDSLLRQIAGLTQTMIGIATGRMGTAATCVLNACHYVVASHTSEFECCDRSLGLAVLPACLLRQLGPEVAHQVMPEGLLGVADALAVGLVNDVIRSSQPPPPLDGREELACAAADALAGARFPHVVTPPPRAPTVATNGADGEVVGGDCPQSRCRCREITMADEVDPPAHGAPLLVQSLPAGTTGAQFAADLACTGTAGRHELLRIIGSRVDEHLHVPPSLPVDQPQAGREARPAGAAASPGGAAWPGPPPGLETTGHHPRGSVTTEAIDVVSSWDLKDPAGVVDQHAVAMEGLTSYAPGPVAAADALDEDCDEDLVSLMICGLPCKITSEVLVQEVDKLGFAGRYRLHVPAPRGRSEGSTKKRAGNLGYAFIAFPSAEDAAMFSKLFDGFKFGDTLSTKRCSVRNAHVQGRVGAALLRPSAAQTEVEAQAAVITPPPAAPQGSSHQFESGGASGGAHAEKGCCAF